MRTARFAILVGSALCFGCVGRGPEVSAPGTGALWGYVGLVRREGVKPVKRDDPVYADKRLGDVETVDYRRPGFSVVYLEGAPVPPETREIVLRAGSDGAVRFDPEHSAVGQGNRILVRNLDRGAHTISCPEEGVFRRVSPGDHVEVTLRIDGVRRLFAVDLRETEALVFSAPGPHAVVASDGRWELPNLPPGAGRVRAWHSRFPSAAREVTVPRDASVRVDLELRVENVNLDK